MSFPWAKQYEPKQPLMRWLDEKLPVPRLVYNAVGAGYPVTRNLNYFWNFGVLAGAALGAFLVLRAGPGWALVVSAVMIAVVLAVAAASSRTPQEWHAPR